MKYYLYETNVCASIESWIPDLYLKEARSLGKKLKLITVIK